MIQKLFKTQRIDYLFFGSFAGLIIVLLLLIIVITYHLTVQELAGSTSHYQQKLLNELNKQIALRMKSVEQVSLAISRNEDLLNFLSMNDDFYARQRAQIEIEKYLANEVYSTMIIQSIELYMKNPALPVTKRGTVTIAAMDRLKKQVWYPMVERSDFTWIEEHQIDTDFHGKQSVISFARKIYDSFGKFRGVLILNVQASSIKEILQGEESEVKRILLDTGKRYITSIGNGATKDNVTMYIRQMKEGESYVHAVADGDLKKNGVILVSDKVSTEWTLVEITPWDQITRGSFRIAMILIGVGALFIFISLYFTLFLSRQFFKPIRILLHAMSQSNIGRSQIDLPSDYANEFGVLFKGFQKFVERIRELYQSLEDKYLRQREVEIRALQAMIHPHFLYNTLDQVNWMAIEANQRKISRVLELMGRMFRIGLSNGETLITIREELEHVRCYLEIQQIRWEEGLTVTIDVPEPLKDLYIPKLTLQPFVENAVVHGFNDRETGTIEIRASETPKGILIIVQDDGVGIRPDWKTRKVTNTGGYGIRNVMERIDAYFGPPYGIDITGLPDQGTTVNIYIPRLTEKSRGGENNVENGNH